MEKNYEPQLPAGYREAKVVDAKGDKRFLIFMNLAALFLAVAVLVPAVWFIKPENILKGFSGAGYFLLVAAMFSYIVLHELTHGLVYKLLTKQKLTFGLTLTVAYCGVPNIYVYRRAALLSLLAPFTVFLPVFLLPIFLVDQGWSRFCSALLLTIHVSGCAGDLYDTLLYLFRFRSPDTLMQDTGPKQTFYVKIEA